MIDQHKLYLKINWIIYIVFTLLSMYIIISTNIDITEVANSFYIINPYHIHKYLINEMPLILSYPFIQLTNKHLCKKGYYLRFINRRIRNVI